MWRILLPGAIAAALAFPADLQVAAAADLAQVEPALSAAFARQAGGGNVRWITGSSGLLAQQAENGAPFDVLLSANSSYISELVTRGTALGDTVAVYATGHVGLWVPSGSRTSSVSVRTLKDLLKPEVQHIAIANPAHAPYGMAAKEALESAGLWAKVESKLVYGENVRQALQFGESGNVDAVLTAWALVKSKPGAVDLDPVAAKYKPLRQAGVVLKGSHSQQASREFLRFLLSPAARAILTDAGFAGPDN